MYTKQYSELFKHLEIEKQAEEQEEIIASFRRVKNGKAFSFKDIDNVKKEMYRQQGDNYSGKLNIDHAIYSIEKDIEVTYEGVTSSKKRLRKRGLNVERLKRQHRLQYQDVKKEEHQRGVDM